MNKPCDIQSNGRKFWCTHCGQKAMLFDEAHRDEIQDFIMNNCLAEQRAQAFAATMLRGRSHGLTASVSRDGSRKTKLCILKAAVMAAFAVGFLIAVAVSNVPN